MSTVSTTPSVTTAPAASPLRRLYLARFAFAVVWAGLFAATGSTLGAAAAVLLVLYPAVDTAAAVVDARSTRATGAYVNIAVSLGFSWMSGAALADAAGIGSIEVGHMRKKGYPAEFSVGLSASSALISPIMPPSIPAVVYASVAAVSTG